MPHHIWVLITNLGDASVVLPLAMLLILTLVGFESTRAGWLFLRALLGCIAGLVLLKLAFISCAPAWNLQFVSPSGHTCLSILVYGALAAMALGQRMTTPLGLRVTTAAGPRLAFNAVAGDLLEGERSAPSLASSAAARTSALEPAWHRSARLAAATLILPLSAAIAASRISLHDHSPLEVVAGAGVGLLALAAFLLPYRALPLRRLNFPLGRFAALALVVLALTYGEISPAERLLRHFAGVFGTYTGVCGT